MSNNSETVIAYKFCTDELRACPKSELVTLYPLHVLLDQTQILADFVPGMVPTFLYQRAHGDQPSEFKV